MEHFWGECYGECPDCLSNAELEELISETDWDDDETGNA